LAREPLPLVSLPPFAAGATKTPYVSLMTHGSALGGCVPSHVKVSPPTSWAASVVFASDVLVSGVLVSGVAPSWARPSIFASTPESWCFEELSGRASRAAFASALVSAPASCPAHSLPLLEPQPHAQAHDSNTHHPA
jgi:hypothetical protein